MNEEQSKQIRKILKTDLKDFLKIMRDNDICRMKLEDEEKLLGVRLNYEITQINAAEEFSQKIEKCLETIDKIEDIKSNMVGKFYVGTNKDGDHYKGGDKMQKGAVLGFIETMNIMHEIKAPSDGSIINIVAGNGKIVEYGQPVMQYKVN